MATANTIVREVVATVTQETSKATFDGWVLNFTISKNGNSIKSANVYGNKEEATVNASLTEAGSINLGFSNQLYYDATLANAIAVELKAIKASETAV